MTDGRRLFNDMARVASSAAGAFGGMKSRMEGELRDQAERLLARMNLVTREEYDVVAAMARTARIEQEHLAERVAALEAALSAQKSRPARAVKVVQAEPPMAAAPAARPPGRRRAKS
jgi:BMFP domain-containing protein YqiC